MYPDNQFQTEEKSISLLGLISIVIAVFMGIVLFAVILLMSYLEMKTPGGIDDESPLLALAGLAAVGAFIAHLTGAALGFAGLFQNNKKKLFAAVGAFLNSFFVLSLIGLMIIGLISE
jgi:hypothetical protein